MLGSARTCSVRDLAWVLGASVLRGERSTMLLDLAARAHQSVGPRDRRSARAIDCRISPSAGMIIGVSGTVDATGSVYFVESSLNLRVRMANLLTDDVHRIFPMFTTHSGRNSRNRYVARAMSDDKDKNDDGSNTGVVVRTRPKTKKPSMYKVLMLNDDYTPMEFVVHVLERFFNKNREEATRIMLHVHQKGVGVCGVFTYEIAETKVNQVMDFARRHQHPLQCTLEKE